MGQSSDGALECEWDPDYSCEDWAKIEFVNYVRDSIMRETIEIVITQEFINANNDARRLAIATATSVAVGRVAQIIAARIGAVIQAYITETAVAVTLSEILQNSNWYRTDLEVGDKLIFRGGSMTIERSGSGSGSQSGSAGQESYGQNDYGSWLFGIGSYDCHIHYTGSHGHFVAQTVCY